jgi:ATP-dependent helicase/nuclease subunit B
MTRFLENLAVQLITRHGQDLSQVVVILPTQRARLFLSQYLYKISGQVLWAPDFYILPEFVSKLHGGRSANELELLVAFYEVYLDTAKLPETFSSFIRWAPVLLRDFRDVDAALAHSDSVFSDLRNIREIEEWSFNSTDLSSSQTDYLRFWSELGALFNAFALWQDNNQTWSYQRMVRRLCDNAIEISDSTFAEFIYVAGMSAFSPAEEKLMKLLGRCSDLKVIWDIDKYYVDDEMNAAAANYRKSSFQMKKDEIPELIGKRDLSIRLYKTDTAVSQVSAAAAVISKMDTHALHDTCIVLADESYSESFLAALGNLNVPINLALGLPAGRFIHARIIRSILRIRWSRVKKSRGIYHSDLINYLHLLNEAGVAGNESATLLKRLVDDIRVFTDDNYLKRKTEDLPLIAGAFRCFWPADESVISELIPFIDEIPATDEVAVVAKSKILEALHDLNDLILRHDFLINSETILLLYEQVISKVSVFYQGEPISGLQVLNMVETRALDFNHVFILGANDEILPGNQFDQSFIPFDLKAHFGLALPEVKEATYAHTFYRLLHHASEVHVFYSVVSADFKDIEPSRYVLQLQQELARNVNTVQVFQTSFTTQQGDFYQLKVDASDFSRERVKKLLSEGVSPSAINKFIACPLDFYYRYILGLGEEESVEERMTDATFGSMVHLVLEKFYSQFIGSFPGKKDFDTLTEGLDEALDQSLDEVYSVNNTSTGENLLLRSLAKKMLLNFIEIEKQALDETESDKGRKLMEVETKLERLISEDVTQLGFPIQLRGKADRIEELNGDVHIIDYKTGKVDMKHMKPSKECSEMFTDTNKSKALQLMLYTYMYSTQLSPDKIHASIFSMVNHQGGYLYLDRSNLPEGQDMLVNFEQQLLMLLKKMYETEDYQHNTSSRFCEYCY